jgi:hypothetical protein
VELGGKMKQTLLTTIVSLVTISLSACAPGQMLGSTLTPTPTITPTSTATATFTPTPDPTITPTITSTNTPIPTVSKTRINLSPELYLDEHSSPDNLGEHISLPYSYFYDKKTWGYIYHYGNEEWTIAKANKCVLSSNDPRCDSMIDSRRGTTYLQLWKDGSLVYSRNINELAWPHAFYRYGDHWILWFGMDGIYLNQSEGWIVQDGIILNDLYNYDIAFSLFLLNDKPLFFFQRGDQFGISYDNEEVLLPYPNISYSVVCCDGGGSANPRASSTKVGFYVQRGDKDYQYIEIGLRE